MRNDRLTQQYQGQPRGNKLAVRKNLCSTENCKPSRIISILCCLAFVFGILQYMILKENHNINEEHGKIGLIQIIFEASACIALSLSLISIASTIFSCSSIDSSKVSIREYFISIRTARPSQIDSNVLDARATQCRCRDKSLSATPGKESLKQALLNRSSKSFNSL